MIVEHLGAIVEQRQNDPPDRRDALPAPPPDDDAPGYEHADYPPDGLDAPPPDDEDAPGDDPDGEP